MKKFFEILNKTELAITMACVVGFTSVLMLGAVIRLVGHPLNWCNDVALLMLAWTTFLGGDVAFRAGRMVNVDILIARLPAKLQKVVAVAVYIILLAMMAVMVRQGIRLCANVGKRTLEGLPFLGYVWVAASIPTGFSLMFLTAVKRLHDLMVSADPGVISKM